MAKFRTLNKVELEGLEKEFVQFLVVNGISAEDWIKIKTQEVSKADILVDSFSDIVFEKILKDIKYLEIYETKYVRSFYFGEEEVSMITMESQHEVANFKDSNFIVQSMNNPPEDLLIYGSEKPYSKTREEELFQMIESGCLVSNGKLHQSLEIALDNV